MCKYKYTLTEILVVIAIIAILAGIIFGASGAIRQRTAEIKTRAMMKQIQFGLDECKRKFGYYPVQASFGDLEMETLFMKDGDDTSESNIQQKYSVAFKKACDYKSLMIGDDDKLVDYYGYPLQYKSDGKSFFIYSKGLDNKASEAGDTGDDVDDDNIYLD